MRNFRDFLLQNNYQLSWEERHEGHSWGLWRATIDNMLIFFSPFEPNSIESGDMGLLNKFYLDLNYPNPFNPTTKIRFAVPQNEKRETRNVTLKVYDVSGNEVATLVNEEKPAGTYEVEFNAPQLSSGIYFYKLTAGNNSATRKMILLK
ncbi:MAG: T9SS type A sorting domain-containing protein [Ignavibacterium sp.]